MWVNLFNLNPYIFDPKVSGLSANPDRQGEKLPRYHLTHLSWTQRHPMHNPKNGENHSTNQSMNNDDKMNDWRLFIFDTFDFDYFFERKKLILIIFKGSCFRVFYPNGNPKLYKMCTTTIYLTITFHHIQITNHFSRNNGNYPSFHSIKTCVWLFTNLPGNNMWPLSDLLYQKHLILNFEFNITKEK